MENKLRTNKNYWYYYYEHDKTFYTLHWISFLTGWLCDRVAQPK